jgi:cytochrome c oxidase cbb3-type subunit III
MRSANDILGVRIRHVVRLMLLSAMIATPRAASPGQKSPHSTNDGQSVEVPNVDGKQVFESRCAGCHGLDGRGGERAPDIALSEKTQQRSDDQLSRIIAGGVPGTGMPAFASLGSNLKNVVAYVRQLQGKNNAAKFPGDVDRGRALFYGKPRCSECHAISGSGGFIASELSGFGGNHSEAEIRQAIVKPAAATRLGGQMTVKTRDGKEYLGVVRNEDNFSLQLQTTDGAFQLFQKSDLASFSHQPDSLMPANYAATLSRGELDDLVSFLMSAARGVKTEPATSKQAEDEEEE